MIFLGTRLDATQTVYLFPVAPSAHLIRPYCVSQSSLFLYPPLLSPAP